MSSTPRNSHLEAGIDDKIPGSEALTLGLQHGLSMNVYIGPMIIAGIVGLSTGQMSAVIQSTFIACGLAMIIQTKLMHLPVAQGASFIPIAAISGIALANGGGIAGWGVAMSAALIGALGLLLLGFSGLMDKFVNYFIPQIVGAVLLLCIGLSLMPAAVNNIYTAPQASVGQNLILGLVAIISMVTATLLGNRLTGFAGKICRIGSILITFLIGCVLAQFMGVLDLTPVAAAPWFSLPMVMFKDFSSQFDLPSVLTMLVIYLLLLSESTGAWIALANASESPLSKERINKGVVGEALGCLLTSFLGTSPVTGFSSNAGIISLTRVASLPVFYYAGGLFILFGLSGKLSALISVIPGAVIGGVFLVICGTIFLAGLQSLQNVEIKEKETFLIALSVGTVVLIQYMPNDFLLSLPPVLQYFFGSPISVASIVAMALNKVLPEG
ncbi:uracil-xanthine permease family protein [Aerococcus tenax]|uniref:uracil-xanthine permease family protein n=1 Tax=Aerococcus tenax TaxID=3078812 RepID=UPI0018A773F5|nr:solute carrier family 23 protein [Aerococcus tenax]